MRTALRHIADAVVSSVLDQESPGTGKRLPGAHSLRHSAARHWLVVGKVPLNVVSQWLGHANVQVTLRTYLPIVGSDYGMENVP
jgi:integrase